MKLSTPCLLILLLSCGSSNHVDGPSAREIATARLVVSAPNGVPSGHFTMKFNQPARIYHPKRWGLAPTATRWFKVSFINADGEEFFLAPTRVLPKWPHEDDVRALDEGEEIEEPFDLASSDVYELRFSENNDAVARLPRGQYVARARFSVPSSGPTRRLHLTLFTVIAPAVELSVTD